MSTVNYALTTTAKVKTFLGITVSTYDTLIDSLVNQATDFIESFCGRRRFLSSTYSNEIYDSRNGRCVFLNNYPVSSLTAVEYRGGTVSNPVWNTYSADGYLLYGKEGFVKFYAVLPEVSQGLRFSYVAGYLIDFANETDYTKHTLPFDLTQLCTELCARSYNLAKAHGIEMMSTEGQMVKFSADSRAFDAFQNETLRRYQGMRYAI